MYRDFAVSWAAAPALVYLRYRATSIWDIAPFALIFQALFLPIYWFNVLSGRARPLVVLDLRVAAMRAGLAPEALLRRYLGPSVERCWIALGMAGAFWLLAFLLAPEGGVATPYPGRLGSASLFLGMQLSAVGLSLYGGARLVSGMLRGGAARASFSGSDAVAYWALTAAPVAIGYVAFEVLREAGVMPAAALLAAIGATAMHRARARYREILNLFAPPPREAP